LRRGLCLVLFTLLSSPLAHATGDDSIEELSLLAMNREGSRVLVRRGASEGGSLEVHVPGGDKPLEHRVVLADSDTGAPGMQVLHESDLQNALPFVLERIGKPGEWVMPPLPSLVSPDKAAYVRLRLEDAGHVRLDVLRGTETLATTTLPVACSARTAGHGFVVEAHGYFQTALSVYWLPRGVLVLGSVPSNCGHGALTTRGVVWFPAVAWAGKAGVEPHKLASALNTLGMEAYHVQRLAEAARWFEAASWVDPRAELPLYNAASVYALQRATGPMAERLRRLARRGTPLAREKLRKALTDPDFQPSRYALPEDLYPRDAGTP
jgi:hypothetical protein